MTAAQQRDATEEYDGESDERSRRLTSETEMLKVIFADYRFLGKRTKRANVGSVRQRTFIHWRASTRIDAYRRVSTLIDLPSWRHWSDSISREFHQPRFGKAWPLADHEPLTTGQRLTADHRRWSLTTEADHWPGTGHWPLQNYQGWPLTTDNWLLWIQQSHAWVVGGHRPTTGGDMRQRVSPRASTPPATSARLVVEMRSD